ncbi:hypothetical protein [Methylobacterium planeticum]|uniref:Uncharacterized protein n=1 Tax=Methylobacterium planeticum TaxID=2615211 RepID=A0A6N6MHY0_9HYPH|nr:hypothetical protein [Methylobacterium planeticum]KAB1069963.1 hypothetical protein F6X51_24315 [Methylobacterium planeticum]
MRSSKPDQCEVKIDGAWRTANLSEAHGVYRSAPKRCPACHGLVMVHGAYASDRRLSLAHRKGHSGCPLMPKKFSGTPSPHPDALA